MKIYSFLLFTIFEGVIFFKINKGITVETIKIIRIIAKTNKNIVGLKQSCPDMDLISEIKARTGEDFAIYSGDDSLTLPMLSLGAYGVVSVASHLYGTELKRMITLFKAGKIAEAREKMNKILEINVDAMYAVVEPGVRTSDLQAAVEAQGAFYAGDPCSGDSCFIGGNVATNAGGNKAVRYGVTRNQVYGLEMVTPEGEIVEVGARLKKCSTGYCMEQLVIGSEGTLGIITQVTLKLQPLPPYRLDMLAIFTDAVQAMSVVPKVAKAGITPTSIEYMDNPNVRTTSQFLEFAGAPHVEDGIYVIFTIETFTEDELDMKMEQLNDICEECGAIEVLEADDRIWAMRRNCLESVRLVSLVCTTDDVVVPVDQMSDTVKHIIATVKKYPFPLRINAHIGDGNLHIVLCKMDLTDEEWEDNLARFTKEIYTYVYAHGGRLSGEHGIGAKKSGFMEEFTPAGELALMKKIKRAWDPNNILNPGKVFNL